MDEPFAIHVNPETCEVTSSRVPQSDEELQKMETAAMDAIVKKMLFSGEGIIFPDK